MPVKMPAKLIDCSPGAPPPDGERRELLVVEGDSASRAVARLRDARHQAVLPMQGKPLNAAKASAAAVQRNVWFTALMDALGMDWAAPEPSQMRYDRLLLLFDPDADGIHCGALTLIFIDRYLRPLLEAHRVTLIKPPMFEIRAEGYRDRLHAYSEDQWRRLRLHLDERGIRYTRTRFRGLASMDDEVLKESCLDPRSRTAYLVQTGDAAAARRLFGPR
jgi:DNA gyrase subunit B/topoisomerase-4 subunit B